MRRIALVTAVLVLSALAAQPAAAQPGIYAPSAPPSYGVYNRPLLSPYLNLLRGGDTASNYFLGVVPEQNRRFNDRLFRSEIRDLERRTADTSTPGDFEDLITPLGSTGHPTAFLNTVGYFGAGAGRVGVPNPGFTRPPPRRR